MKAYANILKHAALRYIATTGSATESDSADEWVLLSAVPEKVTLPNGVEAVVFLLLLPKTYWLYTQGE